MHKEHPIFLSRLSDVLVPFGRTNLLQLHLPVRPQMSLPLAAVNGWSMSVSRLLALEHAQHKALTMDRPSGGPGQPVSAAEHTARLHGVFLLRQIYTDTD